MGSRDHALSHLALWSPHITLKDIPYDRYLRTLGQRNRNTQSDNGNNDIVVAVNFLEMPRGNEQGKGNVINTSGGEGSGFKSQTLT